MDEVFSIIGITHLIANLIYGKKEMQMYSPFKITGVISRKFSDTKKKEFSMKKSRYIAQSSPVGFETK